jgi:hypothetical protein
MHPSGLLVTTRDRTAVDVAAEAGLPEALITLDSAARMNLRDRVGRAWLRDEYVKARSLREAVRPLAAAAERGQTQFTRGQLQEALALVDPRRESPAESLSFGHMVLADLPLPELQVRLTDDEGDMFPDFLWREKMLVGEVDGHVKYQTRGDLIAERRREARMRALGLPCRALGGSHHPGDAPEGHAHGGVRSGVGAPSRLAGCRPDLAHPTHLTRWSSRALSGPCASCARSQRSDRRGKVRAVRKVRSVPQRGASLRRFDARGSGLGRVQAAGRGTRGGVSGLAQPARRSAATSTRSSVAVRATRTCRAPAAP